MKSMKSIYIKGVRCGGYHSGNHGLVWADKSHSSAECQGCGQFYTDRSIKEAKASTNPGEMGQGGVIR